MNWTSDSGLDRSLRQLERLIRLYPQPTRQLADDMLRDFTDRYREVRARSGRMGTTWLWLRTVADVSRAILLERWSARRMTGSSGLSSDLRFDIGYAARVLRRQPGYTIVAVLTLALGIGANAAIFSVVNGVLFLSLPYDDPERVVQVSTSNVPRGWINFGVSPQDAIDWSAQNTVFTDLGMYHSARGNLSGTERPERVDFGRVTSSLFDVLGVEPILGRTFSSDEDVVGNGNVAVLSYGFWQRAFGANASIIGQRVMLDGAALEIVGVMPQTFAFPGASTELWRPFEMEWGGDDRRGARWLAVIARLAPGTDVDDARREMDVIGKRLEAAYPESNTDWTIEITPRLTIITANVRPVLLVLWGTVGFVLLIACANVANLALARSTARSREMAVRTAIGAGRGRLIRQLLTESLLLAVVGGLTGVALAYQGVSILQGVAQSQLTSLANIQIDGRVLVYALIVTLIAGVIFGTVPALRASRTRPIESLREGGRGSVSAGAQRVRNGLVITQLGLALAVLMGTGLTIRSLDRLTRVDPGFDSGNVLTFRIAPPWTEYPERAQAVQLYDQLFERLEGIPGVESVAASNRLPLGGNWWVTSFATDLNPAPDAGNKPNANLRVVTPGYFETMGIPLLQGRRFSRSDEDGAPDVVIINASLADAYWPSEDPVGRRLTFEGDTDDPRWYTIIGVAGDVRHNQMGVAATPVVYTAFSQAPFGHFNDWAMGVLVATAGDPGLLADQVREAMLIEAPTLPLYSMNTLEDIVRTSTAGQRFNTLLLAIFGAVALGLASIGVYGVMSYAVGQRKRELGIRIALGADSGRMVGLVLRHGLVLLASGMVVGALLATALGRGLASMLYETTPSDPVTFMGVGGVLVVTGLLAAYVPARRAARVDPAVTLREE